MNPIPRTMSLLGSTLIILAVVGVGTFQLFNIWAAMAAVFAAAWLISRILKQGLAMGAHFMKESMKMDQDFEDSRFGTAEEAGIVGKLQEAADSVTDTDLQEALHHFTHLATDCPDSKSHAGSLLLVLMHLQIRLNQSRVPALTTEDRSMPMH